MKLSDRPIFIVGSPRSGTTIMTQIIDAHPHIFCSMWETGLFEIFDTMLQGHVAWVLKEHKGAFPLDRSDLLQWIRETVENLFLRLAEKCGKARWAEKTPVHVFHMRLIHELFPKAQFIHMIRNGYEVVRSLQQMPWAPRQIRWSIQRWVESIKVGREFGASLPADQYCEVRYEELVSDPEKTLKSICNFLGEPFAAQMLESHVPENNSWNYRMSPLQKGPVHAHKGLNLLERALFSWYAKPLMKNLGYTL